MAKRKLQHLHKIKIHNNRWLIWAISYVILVTIAIVGYVKISDELINSELIAENTYSSWHSYKDTRLGFQLRYPSQWAIEADLASSINFLPSEFSDNGVNIMVTTPATEASIRKTLNISDETLTLLHNEPAAALINDLGNNQSETVILANHNHRLYVVRGTSNFVQKILTTFKFIDK